MSHKIHEQDYWESDHYDLEKLSYKSEELMDHYFHADYEKIKQIEFDKYTLRSIYEILSRYFKDDDIKHIYFTLAIYCQIQKKNSQYVDPRKIYLCLKDLYLIVVYREQEILTGSDSSDTLIDIEINHDILITYTSKDVDDWYREYDRVMSIRDIPNNKVYTFYRHYYCDHPDVECEK